MRKILFLAANPKDTTRLRLDEEVREIKDALQRSKHRDDFEIEQAWAVRPRDIRRAISEHKPQIIHFSGHGNGQGIIVEDQHGKALPITSRALTKLFRRLTQDDKVNIECVLLNACDTENQAEAIAEHVDFVIGMKQEIQDPLAVEFAVAFYDELGAGEPIRSAYDEGCVAIELEGGDGDMPTLKGKAVTGNSIKTESDIPKIYPEKVKSVDIRNENQNSSEYELSKILKDLPVPPHYSFDKESVAHKGGMGVVVKAYSERLQKNVALKFALDQIGKSSLGRFKREISRLQKYDHPSIVSVLDYDDTHDPPYFVMDWQEGDTLDQYLQGEKTPVSEILAVFTQIADALAYIHSLGDTHRDIKPSNVMVLNEEINGVPLIKLLDFGIVLSNEPDSVQLTSVSQSMKLGTPAYMSPEQFINPSTVDARSDLYSLGVMLYQALTERLPFMSTGRELELEHQKEPPIPPSKITALVTLELDDLILKLLEKNPHQRFPSAEALLYDLYLLMQEADALENIQLDKYQPQLRKSPLQERKNELNTLKQRYQSIGQTPNQLVLLHSPTGFGKSRLFAEFQLWLSQQAVILLHVDVPSVVAANGSSPLFGPIKEIVREAVRQLAALQPDSEYPRLGPLVYLLGNEIPAQFRGAFSPSGYHPEQIRSFMFDAVVYLLDTLADSMPIVVLFDDLHQADPDSQELISFILAALSKKHSPILFCASACSEEPLTLEWRQMLVNLNHGRLINTVKLTFLSESNTVAMVTGMLGHPLPDLAQQIYEKTQGNPFAIESILYSLVKENELIRQDGIWAWDGKEIQLSIDIQDVVRLRLQNLNAEKLSLLQMAAIIGVQFHFDQLLDVSQHHDEDKLIDIVYEWKRMEEVQEVEEDIFVFKHKIVHEYCLQDLPSRKYKRLHLKTAQAIEERYQDNLDIHAEALALHYSEAEKPVDSLAYVVQTARFAFERGGYLKTAQILHQYTWLNTSELEPLMQFDLHDLTGDTQAKLGKHQQALESYLAAYAVCEQALPQDIHAHQRISIAHKIGREYGWQGEIDKANEWMERGRNIVALPSNANEREELAQLEIHTGFLAYQEGDYLQAEEACTRGLTALAPIDSEAVRAEGLLILGAAQDAQGKYQNAQKAYTESIAIWQRLNNPHEVHRVENNLAATHLLLGQLEEAEPTFERVAKFFDEIGDSNRQITAITNLGLVYFRQGRYLPAKENHLQAMKLADEHDIPWLQSLTRVNLAWVYLTDKLPGATSSAERQEELLRAKVQAEKSIAIEEKHNLGQSAAEAHRILAHIAIEQANYSKAIELAIKAQKYATAGGDILEAGAAMRTLGRVSVKQGNFNRAELNLNESLAILEPLNNPYEIGLTHRQLAWLYHETESPQETFIHALKAIAFLQRIAPTETARMREDKRTKLELSLTIDTCLEVVQNTMNASGWSLQSTQEMSDNTRDICFRFDNALENQEPEITLLLRWSPEQKITHIEFTE